jgi:hypothetical protein
MIGGGGGGREVRTAVVSRRNSVHSLSADFHLGAGLSISY